MIFLIAQKHVARADLTLHGKFLLKKYEECRSHYVEFLRLRKYAERYEQSFSSSIQALDYNCPKDIRYHSEFLGEGGDFAVVRIKCDKEDSYIAKFLL